MSENTAKILKQSAVFCGLLLYLLLAVYLFRTVDEEAVSEKDAIVLTLTVPAGYTTEPIYRRMIADFEQENPGVKVKLITISAKNYYQKVMVMIAGNAAPDLMWMGQSFSEFAHKGVFLDLSEKIRAENIRLDNYKQEALNWYRQGGQILSLPFGIDLSVLVYNRKLFREAGLPMPRDDWQFEEFLHAAKALTVKDAGGRVRRYGFQGTLEAGIFGASPLDPVSGVLSCNTPEMISFFETNLKMNREWHVSPTPEEAQGMSSDANGLFRQERVAMMMLYTYGMPQAFEVFSGMDFDITLLPRAKQQSQWSSSQAICIYRHTKHPEEAWKLFLLTQSREFQMAMSLRSIPPRLDLIDDALAPAPGRPENYAVLRKALDVMTPTPRVVHLQELLFVYRRFAGQIFTGRISAAEGMRLCEIEMLRRMEQFRKTDME